MAVGGDVLELTSNHPSLGSFIYKVVRNQDNTYDTGGDRTNDDANMKTGGNEAIWQINGKMGAVNITLVNDMEQKTVERLEQEAAHPVPSVWTFSVINGKTYKGEGKPVGDINPNINNSTVAVKIAAPSFQQV